MLNKTDKCDGALQNSTLRNRALRDGALQNNTLRNRALRDGALQKLLLTNIPPETEEQKRLLLIRQLSAEAEHMDYLSRESFGEKILTAVSYFSLRSWLAHLALLVLFFVCTLWGKESTILACLFSLAPGLALLFLFELSKTFSCNMWEMEAACRYNLPQLFFMRLCTLSGLDFFILAGCLAVFRLSGGLLLQFMVCTLLPFFLLSSLCLLLLRHYGRWGSLTGVASAAVLLSVLWLPLAQIFERIRLFWGDRILTAVVLLATLGALLLYLGCAAALCQTRHWRTAAQAEKISCYGKG